MDEPLFDRADEYDEMLARGLALSGETRAYFVAHRVAYLERVLVPPPTRILDFGCGTGETSAALARVFPRARVTGVDTAQGAVAHARGRHAGERVDFAELEDFDPDASFDLCYASGVFHHIAPALRAGALATVRAALAPGGRFAFFENNPWNPGTRLVMARIPFDRDAVTIAPLQARRLLEAAGFEAQAPRAFFFFPRALRFLRFSEPWLRFVPLGAQYLVLAER